MLRQLAREILRLDRTAGEAVVDATIEIGRRLVAAHDRADHGTWLDWIERELPFGPRTAQRYTNLARWADAHPADLQRIRHLGLSKVLRLAAAPPDVRGALPMRGAIAIPGMDHAKPVVAMTVAELGRVIDEFATETLGDDPGPSMTKVEQAIRSRLTALDTWTDILIDRADEADESFVSELREELGALIEAVDAAFD